METDGSICTDLCKKAVDEITALLSDPKQRSAVDASAESAGSVLGLDAPMSVGQHFDEAAALFGKPTAGMTYKHTSATLDSVAGGVAQFGVTGTLRFKFENVDMAVKFKGRIARRLSDRALTEDNLAGPLKFEVKTDNGEVHGNGTVLVAEKWTFGQIAK